MGMHNAQVHCKTEIDIEIEIEREREKERKAHKYTFLVSRVRADIIQHHTIQWCVRVR